MNWKEQPIDLDDEGNPRFKGLLKLTNDKNEKLGSICWFYEDGPFYSAAMDVKDISLIRRIGPNSTLDAAKQSVMNALEGKLNISNRAGYER